MKRDVNEAQHPGTHSYCRNARTANNSVTLPRKDGYTRHLLQKIEPPHAEVVRGCDFSRGEGHLGTLEQAA